MKKASQEQIHCLLDEKLVAPGDWPKLIFLIGPEKDARVFFLEAFDSFKNSRKDFKIIDLVQYTSLKKAFKIRSNKYRISRHSIDRFLLLANIAKASPNLQKKVPQLLQNRKFEKFHLPFNWLPVVQVPSERYLYDLLPIKLFMQAAWLPVSDNTDVGTIDIFKAREKLKRRGKRTKITEGTVSFGSDLSTVSLSLLDLATLLDHEEDDSDEVVHKLQTTRGSGRTNNASSDS